MHEGNWYGEAAATLGLHGPVKPKHFEDILAGYVPGTDLRLGRLRDGEHQHRPGVDITLCAPKSVSLEALVDEPSIGLEPRFIDMVFEILADLQRRDGKTIVMVEQNAKKGLEFADIGYFLVSGRLAMAGPGDALLEDPSDQAAPSPRNGLKRYLAAFPMKDRLLAAPLTTLCSQ